MVVYQMQKNTYLKSLMLLTLFAGFFLSVPVASAAKPTPITTTFHGHVGLPGEPIYFPGIPKQLGKSHMVRITGRTMQFTMDLTGFGKCLFTSKEDSIINMDTQVGVTYGRIAVVSDTLGPVLSAVSVGQVYPMLVGGYPAMGFRGHFTSIGADNVAHVIGQYSGYFIPDSPVSGLVHMDFEFYIR
jgi:hypothetical protein